MSFWAQFGQQNHFLSCKITWRLPRVSTHLICSFFLNLSLHISLCISIQKIKVIVCALMCYFMHLQPSDTCVRWNMELSVVPLFLKACPWSTTAWIVPHLCVTLEKSICRSNKCKYVSLKALIASCIIFFMHAQKLMTTWNLYKLLIGKPEDLTIKTVRRSKYPKYSLVSD